LVAVPFHPIPHHLPLAKDDVGLANNGNTCDHASMKRIYIAANLTDAHLMRCQLEQAGIATHVFNEHAAAYYGGAAMPAACPQLWITQVQQEAHARAVIAEYLRPRAPADAKNCAACGETSPGEFEICWNCSGQLA
jgi:hypothetical protein